MVIFAATILFACSDDDNSDTDNGGNGNDEIFITFMAHGTSYTMEPASSTSLNSEFPRIRDLITHIAI